ncbi:hypothetical protein TNIN_169001 [Trichonephila inaurata madagascariensis]|uniref:Uncharacterized protein n=1 Tax=Trichonephila inaurata madagascariensis TaxID=2747483 RepID=A0A8X6JZT3_9ARAC|nr:hypothetical protein TNIN_169001 [Trichonephila inaurata madagascariensis]
MNRESFTQKVSRVKEEINVTSKSLTYVPSVAVFFATCEEAVLSSEILLELFDFSHVTPEEYIKGISKYIANAMRAAQVPDARQQTEICTNQMSKYHKTLNLPLVLRVNAYTTAKFLFLKGVLNEQNVVPLALTYATFLEKYATEYKKAGDPDWKFKDLVNGFYNFIARLNLVCKESGYLVAILLNNEWKLANSESNYLFF